MKKMKVMLKVKKVSKKISANFMYLTVTKNVI